VNHADITIGCKLGSRTRAQPFETLSRARPPELGSFRSVVFQRQEVRCNAEVIFMVAAPKKRSRVRGHLRYHIGRGVGFLIVGGVVAAATRMVWMLLPETKPEQYQD
jgi:hypothetical protein